MESFDGQIANSSLPNLLRVAVTVRTEVFSFYESAEDVISDELGKMLLLAEFTNDKNLGLCHGIGKGHCLVRVAFLRKVLADVSPAQIPDYATLVQHFRSHGYTVKRVQSVGSMREMRAALERPAAARPSVVGCVVLTVMLVVLGYGIISLLRWLF